MRKNNGITIIALVVTIIVMLVMVGVVLQFITGDNGIIKKTETAVTNLKKSAEKEEIETAYASLLMDNKINETEINAEI